MRAEATTLRLETQPFRQAQFQIHALHGGAAWPFAEVIESRKQQRLRVVGKHSERLGRWDDFVTRSGVVMSPVVVWAGPQTSFAHDPSEVESVHRIAAREFLREDAPLLEPGEDPARPVLRMPVGDSWIAAPTAAILLQFREVCLLGLHTRVAHFDQPAFAWR